MSSYGDPKYWEKRYIKEEGERFDWLEDYGTLEQYLKKYMIQEKGTRILNIGCGNGEIQDKLYESGYESITNNDISSSLIKHMAETNRCPKMLYEVMDVTDMTYQNETFDMVLDKSTIDALLCSQSPLTSVAKMLYHIHRVLVDGGYYFIVSYGNPVSRLLHLNRKHVNFHIKVIEIEGRNGNPHFIYACQKKPMKYDQEYTSLLSQLEQEDIKLMNEESGYEEKDDQGYGDLFGSDQNES